MSTDSKGAKILARTFFAQLRASGYNPNQIIGIATELIDLVTTELREAEKEDEIPADQVQAGAEVKHLRHTA